MLILGFPRYRVRRSRMPQAPTTPHRYGLVRDSGDSVRTRRTRDQIEIRLGATLTVRDPGGEAKDIKVFGSMLEKDRAWKVFSYVVD